MENQMNDSNAIFACELRRKLSLRFGEGSRESLDEEFEEIIKAIKKMSEEEKTECREHLRWSLYDSKLRKDVVN